MREEGEGQEGRAWYDEGHVEKPIRNSLASHLSAATKRVREPEEPELISQQ